MEKYKYETVTLGYSLSKKSLTKKLQETLDERQKMDGDLLNLIFQIGLELV